MNMAARTSRSFEASLARARAVQLAEQASARVNPTCHSVLMEHGRRTPRAVVFMHGITSSPVQFQELGERFFARGYNVFIPRMPRHGHADRLTREQALLTATEFTAFTSQTIEIACGLGNHLTVSGLSVSGVLTAWGAQHEPAIDLAVLIAPAFAPHGVPLRLMPVLAYLARRLPNLFVWWDFKLRARVGPACNYPRFSTHALAESFAIGLDVYRVAKRNAPACNSILAITNPRDMAVNNAATAAVVRRWRSHGPADVHEYAFPTDLGAIHDVIGPYQPDARIDKVYPILLDLIDAKVA